MPPTELHNNFLYLSKFNLLILDFNSQQASHLNNNSEIDFMSKFVAIGIAPRGIIAIGLVPMGFIAIGGVSMGIITIGIVGMGLINACLVGCGLIVYGLKVMGLS